MEPANSQKVHKAKPASASTVSVRLRRETKRRIQNELARVNKKDFGKRVKADALIGRALGLLTEQHIKELQDASLSNADRLEMLYRDHVKQHGATTKDDFLGTLIGKV